MSNTKHTPGPWFVSNHTKNDVVCYPNKHIKMPLKVASAAYTKNTNIPSVSNSDEMQANAKLIAAAPELLEALIVAVGHIKGYISEGHKDMAMFKAAIKKATE